MHNDSAEVRWVAAMMGALLAIGLPARGEAGVRPVGTAGASAACPTKRGGPRIAECAACILARGFDACAMCRLRRIMRRAGRQRLVVIAGMSCAEYERCRILGHQINNFMSLLSCPVYRYHAECCSPDGRDRCGCFDSRLGGQVDYCGHRGFRQSCPAFRDHERCREQGKSKVRSRLVGTRIQPAPICSIYRSNKAPTCGGNLRRWSGPVRARPPRPWGTLLGRWLPINVVREVASCGRGEPRRTAAKGLWRRLRRTRVCAPEGRRVQARGARGIYLVMDGRRRLIPNLRVYHRLFRSARGIDHSACVRKIPDGPPLAGNARLCRIGRAVFFDDGKVKRHVATRSVMDRYHFARNKVQARCVSARTGPAMR